ncbi:uncharacterized protein LOC6600163 [Drosophila persimilis]|uniref:uncharacterized protein LOC6600163 n=1 Tax=Drosophila persimilis TaxID=7234 RepID=UPI000F084181|nr:uncharacterized protein LOC6600163 [Drosophila persimilis]
MTLPTNTNVAANGGSGSDDDSDMFGPPRCSPPMGHHHHRSRVPMISPKLRQREERKRILQLCAHKMERIKDSETNLRRSVCINNTYCRLNDELRREKQLRHLQNLPSNINSNISNAKSQYGDCSSTGRTMCSIENQPMRQQPTTPASAAAQSATAVVRKRNLSSSNLVNDLEILDRELSAINAPMLLIDPEITQGAEQLEKASLSASRKRMRSNSISEDESDRLVREALSQFYIPPQRLISAIEECPLDVVGLGMGMGNQKDFEVIMDALRLGTPTSPSVANDSCGQAAMLSESASVFHNLVVTSLET